MMLKVRKFSTAPVVGFVGLGNMGKCMALNLLKAQSLTSSLIVLDLVKDAVDALVQKGAVAATGIAHIAKSCDVIITMVPNTQQVTEVLRGESGVFANSRPGTLIIDCSTIDPITSAALHAEAATKGLKMLDAIARSSSSKSWISVGY